MHPEIRKYWETLSQYSKIGFDGKIYFQFYLEGDGGIGTGYIRASYDIDGKLLYHLHGRLYFEETMLRMLKLKAFW